MPVLPLIDLLIMVGWTSLMGAGLLKAIYLTTAYRPSLLGMGPGDFVLLSVACLLFALTLAARTWVKYHEPEFMARRRRGAAAGSLANGMDAPAGHSGASAGGEGDQAAWRRPGSSERAEAASST